MKNRFTIKVVFWLLLPISLYSQQTSFQRVIEYTNLSDIVQTSDSGFITTGWTFGQGVSNACLLKVNSNGEKIWASSFGESKDAILFSVDTTSDNGYIIAGANYGADMYVLKTNGSGALEWAKTYGGAGDDLARNIYKTSDGGFILCGRTSSFGAGDADIYIVKLNKKGEVQWSKTFGGLFADVAESLCETFDGGFALLASLNISTPTERLGIIKIDSKGETLWSKTYVDTFPKIGYEIIQTKEHNLALVGTGYDDFYLLLADSIGNFKWAKYYGIDNSGDNSYSLIQTKDNGFMIAGNSNGFDGGIYPLALKLNSNGDQEWCTSIKTQDYGIAFSVIQSYDGGYVFAGEEDEIFKIDSNGENHCWATKEILNVKEWPTTVSNITLIESSPNTITKISNTVIQPEVTVIEVCTPVATKTINKEVKVEIAPNPASSYFTIHSDELLNNTPIEIYDILGHKVYIARVDDSEIINCQKLQPGLYLVKLKFDNHIYSSKLIISRN